MMCAPIIADLNAPRCGASAAPASPQGFATTISGRMTPALICVAPEMAVGLLPGVR